MLYVLYYFFISSLGVKKRKRRNERSTESKEEKSFARWIMRFLPFLSLESSCCVRSSRSKYDTNKSSFFHCVCNGKYLMLNKFCSYLLLVFVLGEFFFRARINLWLYLHANTKFCEIIFTLKKALLYNASNKINFAA